MFQNYGSCISCGVIPVSYTHLNTEVVKATIVGEHGDAQIPIWSRASIAGVPLQEYCENVGLKWDEEIRKEISDKVREMGATIIKGKGRTHYGIATCVCYLAEAVLNQRLTICLLYTSHVCIARYSEYSNRRNQE